MSGAFIASFTAFLTAGLGLKHWLVWVLPTVFITIWIIYWIKKYKRPKKMKV
jgi:cytochrome c-type biogenesis protein CcmH/NrfF